MKHVLPSVPIVGYNLLKFQALLLGLLIFFFSISAFPQDSPHELEHDLVLDGAIAGTGLLFGLLAETALKTPLSRESCGWCEPTGFDESLRNTFKWDDVGPALLISDTLALSQIVSVYSVMAFSGYQSGRADFIAQDLLLITESVATTLVLTNIVKLAVGRQRPFSYFDSTGLSKRESNFSFFSGHSSITAATVAAGTTIAFLRGYDEAPWILGIGGTLALATGYFRIAGDVHYATDVITGLLVGTTLGIGIPLLFHGRKEKDGEAIQQSQSLSIGLSSVNFRLAF